MEASATSRRRADFFTVPVPTMREGEVVTYKLPLRTRIFYATVPALGIVMNVAWMVVVAIVISDPTARLLLMVVNASAGTYCAITTVKILIGK